MQVGKYLADHALYISVSWLAIVRLAHPMITINELSFSQVNVRLCHYCNQTSRSCNTYKHLHMKLINTLEELRYYFNTLTQGLNHHGFDFVGSTEDARQEAAGAGIRPPVEAVAHLQSA